MNIEPKQELLGERIILRKPDVSFDFANKFFTLVDANREHILPWLDWGMESITKSPESSYSFILDADKAWKNGDKFEYVICDKVTKELLGGIGIMKRGKSIDCHFEIGYWLSKNACGKGYLLEAVKLAEAEFFGLGVERITIKNDIENIKSRQVAEKLGYKFEGIQEHSRYSAYLKSFCDVNVFAKLRGKN